jgi:para-aminobenzoate synthetase component 1
MDCIFSGYGGGIIPVIVTSLDDWKIWSQTYTMLPYVQQFPLRLDRIMSWEKAWESASDCSFVLESGKMGRYTFLGLRPTSTVSGKGREAVVRNKNEVDSHPLYGDPLSIVKQWMKPFQSPKVDHAPKFIGGCVGYWGYDVVRSIEKIPETTVDDIPCPDYYFMMINELWIIDHDQQKLYCATHTPVESGLGSEELTDLYHAAGRQAEEMKTLWDQLMGKENAAAVQRNHVYSSAKEQDKLFIDVEAVQGIQTAFKKEDFMEAVRQIQRYISQGDVFQVNLSVRQNRKLKSSPEEVYEWLRLFNPSPYMGCLRFPDFQLVSASPELLVKLEGDKVSTRPIAGTRRRGKDEQDDLDMAEELLLNEKERAEHIMLLDLERNDLGRIAKYGTVRVSDFMVIEYYSHVMHIVSEVEGQLAEGKDVFDVIAATFPGGTITGAPKVRTMEIIEELEPVRRGPYTGSIGWIDYNGNMEFNITIRTLLVANQMGFIQAGAGIVIDSDPKREYMEALNKAKALWKAIEYSEQMMSETGRN